MQSASGDLEVLIDTSLGVAGSAQASLRYLAKSLDPKAIPTAAAVVVCGDPFDVTAPKMAALAVKESQAPVLVISGKYGPPKTRRLLQLAMKELPRPPHEKQPNVWTLELASEFTGTDWSINYDDLMECQVYLEFVLSELRALDPSIKPEDVSITSCGEGNHDWLRAGAGKKLQILLETSSTNSGQNACECEKLLREYLKDFQPPETEQKRVIFVKAPLMLLRGLLTIKNPGPDTLLEKVERSEWLGGVTEVLPFAGPCPVLTELDALGRLETLVKATGEYKRIRGYNNKFLAVETDFDHGQSERLASWDDVLQNMLKHVQDHAA